ncbi:tRNA uracil 4-sulfurtransferase ThiI [Spartinivicinus ruber]|uniref:tRNA uracil 4-sulfurtransferase ThiI n=1 Tax=Spartinivicinus ruber TaxID=2683272 RepID=UPI0013D70081|nr:tRNA uracil 4-sulfurtransferase ThiI [Spartinivicinus ruber]
MKFIVKLFPEITIKSKPVRQRFVKQLRRNIRWTLKPIDPEIEVIGSWDKIEVVTQQQEKSITQQIAEKLSHTPGICQILEVVDYPLVDLDDMLDKVAAIIGDSLVGHSFCVRCKRSGHHEFTSTDVERYIGGGLHQRIADTSIKLKGPDITVKLEIKNKRFYVVKSVLPGLGGFPLGTQDGVLSLISGGFDSTVSSFLTMKRGLLTHFCFFNLGGHAHEIGVKEVAYYLWNKFGSSHRVKFVTVPFEHVVAEILQNVDKSYMGVVLKRMMLRAASKVAEGLEVEALVTGEAIAQVSSQTLVNLSVIDEVTNNLVLRPLITMDKQDIINTARAIGTEDFAKNIPEYCGVISVNPTTRARRHKVEDVESNFNFAVLDQAVTDRREVLINDIIQDDLKAAEVEVLSIPLPNSVILDIRHPTEEELNPLKMDNNEVKTIPFYQLNTAFKQLDASQQYMLYCDKGVMSRLHAMHLKDEGYKNIKVYRP